MWKNRTEKKRDSNNKNSMVTTNKVYVWEENKVGHSPINETNHINLSLLGRRYDATITFI